MFHPISKYLCTVTVCICIHTYYVYIVHSVDTHPISAVLSSQLSTNRINTSIPIQLTFDTDKVDYRMLFMSQVLTDILLLGF